MIGLQCLPVKRAHVLYFCASFGSKSGWLLCCGLSGTLHTVYSHMCGYCLTLGVLLLLLLLLLLLCCWCWCWCLAGCGLFLYITACQASSCGLSRGQGLRVGRSVTMTTACPEGVYNHTASTHLTSLEHWLTQDCRV